MRPVREKIQPGRRAHDSRSQDLWIQTWDMRRHLCTLQARVMGMCSYRQLCVYCGAASTCPWTRNTRPHPACPRFVTCAGRDNELFHSTERIGARRAPSLEPRVGPFRRMRGSVPEIVSSGEPVRGAVALGGPPLMRQKAKAKDSVPWSYVNLDMVRNVSADNVEGNALLVLSG